MSEPLIYTFIILGLLICTGLTVYIVLQCRSIQSQSRIKAEKAREAEAKALEHRSYLIESIHVIAKAMIHDEKLTLTEGSIRLSALLDQLAPALKQEPDIIVIGRVQEATNHIPYLKAWKVLDKKEQRRYLREMHVIETEHRDALLKAAEVLSSYPFEQRFH
ncbi:MAG: DUF2489 domain-containing protein [Pontibacterium sp.]